MGNDDDHSHSTLETAEIEFRELLYLFSKEIPGKARSPQVHRVNMVCERITRQGTEQCRSEAVELNGHIRALKMCTVPSGTCKEMRFI